MSAVDIAAAEAVEIAVEDRPWPFAEANRSAIDDHFAALRAAKPSLFNAPIYMLATWRLEAGTFRGTAFATDYASFLAWRDRGSPDAGVTHVFGSGAMFTADGALLLGIMAADTANAGRIYPPSGSLETADLRDDGRLDVAGNIVREIAEETGLDVAHRMERGWWVVRDGPRVALMRRLALGLDAAAAQARIAAHMAAQPVPELAGIHLVRGTGDIVESRMPPYTQAFIRHVFGG